MTCPTHDLDIITINDVFACRVILRLCNAGGKPMAKNIVTWSNRRETKKYEAISG